MYILLLVSTEEAFRNLTARTGEPKEDAEVGRAQKLCSLEPLLTLRFC